MASKNTVCQMCVEKEDEKIHLSCKLCGTPSMDRYCRHNMPIDDDGISWKCDECTSQNMKQPLRDAPDRTRAREKGKGKATDFQVQETKQQRRMPILPKEGSSVKMSEPATVATSQSNQDHAPAKPNTVPIWRGRCEIHKQPKSIVKVAARSSTKCGSKVTTFARAMPPNLKLKMVSKRDVWSTTFESVAPTVDSIGLYLFPDYERGEGEDFSNMVQEMADKHLALKTLNNQFTDVNILVFSSRELPAENWYIEGKYYLWAVIREKSVLAKTVPKSYCLHNMPGDDDGIIWKCDECTSQNRMQPLRDAPDHTHAREKGKGKATDFQVQETKQQRRMPILPKEGSSVKMSEPATVATSQSNQDHAPAKPNTVPIWRGRCEIHKQPKSIVKVAARSSTKCGSKVTTFARAMPPNLKLKMVSKRDVWSTTFESVAPTVDSIDLYLFPDYERGEDEDLSKMVQDMADKHLALKTLNNQFTDVNILVFSSRELPAENWYIEGKYYLWAVIREKSVLAKTLPKK